MEVNMVTIELRVTADIVALAKVIVAIALLLT
jgi:hypothetical protein